MEVKYAATICKGRGSFSVVVVNSFLHLQCQSGGLATVPTGPNKLYFSSQVWVLSLTKIIHTRFSIENQEIQREQVSKEHTLSLSLSNNLATEPFKDLDLKSPNLS